MDIEKSVGNTVWTLGYCTHAWLLRGKSLGQLERLLGCRSGRLDEGATIMFLQRSPGAADFQLAGYTYFPDGTEGGHKLEPQEREPRRMESLLPGTQPENFAGYKIQGFVTSRSLLKSRAPRPSALLIAMSYISVRRNLD